MSPPTVSQVEAWRPDVLARLGEDWERAARLIAANAEALDGGFAFWHGAAADEARAHAKDIVANTDTLATALVLAAAAARDGAEQITLARAAVLAAVRTACDDGFEVADDGTVTPATSPSPLLVALSGGDPPLAAELLTARARALTADVTAALEHLESADADAAADLAEAFTLPVGTAAVGADVVAAWPTTGQDAIAAQLESMPADQREQLVARFPRQVGNTDGVPWHLRVQANRTNIAQAVLHEADPARLDVYRALLAETDDPTGGQLRRDRQILAFDPARASLVELHGDLAKASSVAVLVPGLGTTIAGSAANNRTAQRFVTATRGRVAAITYLGGPFPRGDNPLTALAAAADPRYALGMAPRLVAFTEDVNRRVDATGRRIPVTVIGHSYGGSIVGTAETLGLTSDRTLFVAAAGAGVGVDDAGDWHNRNPDVLRFSMTPPGDLITAVQGVPGGPHGADPDELDGVIRLGTGYYDDGRPMAGPRAHSDVLNWPSDSWRAILGVITGDIGADRSTLPETG
ncbi:alpha/beta hydrolase [Mycolicibacterium flavescens]|uniref:Alpha/beta hydrolase n=1 Tax=Mycolicibacterium flavescens TaxID=1776 RepID=A0A1E3RKE7_MYCFV|nr:alpha/beta hydrolase [Mycolicibacterium flavescens]MCV7281029.1 alpha/beta hydrolase [Mycolicibacterium flavescens]ODQ90330.1 alpha/beta hydrolase [Mycolicibacterium flavescens]